MGSVNQVEQAIPSFCGKLLYCTAGFPTLLFSTVEYPSRETLSTNTLILTICLCGLTFSAPHYHLKNCVLHLRSICRWVRWEAGLHHHLSKATALITSRDGDYSSWLNIHHRPLKLLCLENSRQLPAVTYLPRVTIPPCIRNQRFWRKHGIWKKLGTQISWEKKNKLIATAFSILRSTSNYTLILYLVLYLNKEFMLSLFYSINTYFRCKSISRYL